MGNNIKDIQQIKSLIAKGKEMGFLTFEEVNKAVPLEMNTPEQFEEIIGIFDQLEIAIVDLEKDGKKIPVTSAETDGEQSEERLELVDNEDAADFSSRSTDPVRMYLREMGAVPLLDRDGEVTIAKKIEQGEQDVLYALVEVPVAVEELINVGEDLKLNRIKLKDVVKTIEEDDPTEDEMNQRTRVILLLEEIRQTFKKKRKIYAKLDECCTLERRVTAIQKEIMAFKEEIVTRLRDIKLEKTLIDRIIETVEDYVRQMQQLSARPVGVPPVHGQESGRNQGPVPQARFPRHQPRARRQGIEHERGRAVLLQGNDPWEDRNPPAPSGKMLPQCERS